MIVIVVIVIASSAGSGGGDIPSGKKLAGAAWHDRV